MSQVIPSHVLRVGQTICIASREESRSQRPDGSLCCPSLEPQCSYSTEGWLGQPAMAQTKARRLASGALQEPHANAVFTRVASPTPGKEHPVAPLGRASPAYQPEGEEKTEGNPEASLVSPTLDVSLESLNQLILEIDPTFQPLLLKPDSSRKYPAHPTSPGNAAVTEKPDPDSLEIKYIEMTPTRAKSHDSVQGAASLGGTPLSRSPQGSCFLLPGGALARDNCTPNGSLVFSSPSGPDSNRATPQNQPPPGSSPQPCSRVSEWVSIPQRAQKDCNSSRPNTPLATSPGLESLRKALYLGRAQQRASRVSVLSTSPGSDTSYMLGSSTQSLLNDEPDSSQPAHRSAESPLSVGSFPSPCPPSPGGQVGRSGEVFIPGSCSNKGNPSSSPPLQKGNASSCPPSLVNSTAEIPILLVNGCLEYGETSPRMSKDFQGSVNQMVSPSPGSSSGISSWNTTSSEISLSSASDSPSKDGEPSMKFVMDTSKYWFKPSITRDQAIQLLREAEPGAFLMRDSTSFRGSFGLAMKVLGKPGDDSSDLVRHFLIESSAKGVHLKGASEEPYFGSLSAFVYQHAIIPLALPCKLAIPTRDFAGGENSSETPLGAALSARKKTAACNVLYLNSVSVERLSGASAVRKAVSSTLELETPPMPTVVHFKVSEQGITLTDVQRKVFFRRHYPLTALSFCSMDPENRKWQKYCKSSRIFGFVAKSQMDAENLCHLFAEYDPVQPAFLVIDLISQLLPEQ